MRRIEWMCTTCGRKVTRGEQSGRPLPGICPKKPNKSHHTLVKNRITGK